MNLSVSLVCAIPMPVIQVGGLGAKIEARDIQNEGSSAAKRNQMKRWVNHEGHEAHEGMI
jgi:hypothetical protein